MIKKKVGIVTMQQEKSKNIGNEKFDQMSKLTGEESRQEGKIGNLAIVSYFDAASNGAGNWSVLLIIIYFVIQLVWMSTDLILSFWSISNDKLENGDNVSNFNASHCSDIHYIIAAVGCFLSVVGSLAPVYLYFIYVFVQVIIFRIQY